jgi:hypothetical protein
MARVQVVEGGDVLARVFHDHAIQKTTLRVSASLRLLRTSEVVGILAHQLAHAAQQWRRWRRGEAGLVRAAEISDELTRLLRAPRSTPPGVEPTTGAPVCPRCQRPSAAVEWQYVRDRDEAWTRFAGLAGWIAVCSVCRTRIGLLVLEQN